MGQRNKKKKTKKKLGFGKILLYLIMTVCIIALIGAAIAYSIVNNIIKETAPIASYNTENLLSQNSYLYDDQGNLLMNIQRDSVRTIIEYNDIAPIAIDAFVAIEDKTFFEHHGFNYVRLVGAILESFKSGEGPSGTSTITQQYARNMYLPQEKFDRNYVRKVKEAYYAIQIEEHMTKEQIITAYLNTIDLGANVQGIEAASMRYFSKHANELDYIEAAILAGIPKATNDYGPFKNVRYEDITSDMVVIGKHNEELQIVFNENMLPRFKTVILAMRNNGYITDSQAEHALSLADNGDLVNFFNPTNFSNTDITSYFSDMVKDEVISKLMTELHLTREEAENKLYGGGLHVYSTLNLPIQKILEDSYNSATWSDYFDNETRNAVVSFQKKYNLGLDGVVGPKTLAKLEELGLLKTEDMTQNVYSVGMNNDEIIILKAALEKDGLLFKHNDNLPRVEPYRDYNKNILGLTEDTHDVVYGSHRILSNFDYVVNSNDEFIVHSNEYKIDDSGNIILFKDQSFDFWNVTNPDGTSGYEAFIKSVYKADENNIKRIQGATNYYAEKVSIKEMYIFKGHNIKIPFEYKKLDDDGNLVISKRYKEEHPEYYHIDENGNLLISPDYYSIDNTGIIQPQSAMVIIDYHNGQLKAIVGGRNVTGQKIYNRAINPRQPGSSIKPIGVYTPALDNGITAATVFDDVPRYTASGQRWPQNYFDSYGVKYKGIMTVREALHDSNNVVAVKIAERLGVENIIPYLERFGISTLVTEGGVNDINLSSVALGGMTKGITPFDITSAYGAIANGGMRNETITFTKIIDAHGNVILENQPQQTYVVDEPVAYLMQHIMESGARLGLAKKAAFRSGNRGIPIAGKTGTTSNKNDAWFVGFSPYYVAGMWIGNDIQVPLSEGSTSAANYWRILMGKIHENLEDKAFKTPQEVGLVAATVDNKSGKIPTPLSYSDPEGNTIITEWFIPGTVPSAEDDTHVNVKICKASEKLAGEFCPEASQEEKVYRLRLDPDYDPNAHGNHYAIADDKYTISRKEYESKKGESFCDIHTEEPWTAEQTIAALSGLPTKRSFYDPNEMIITTSIQITTVHDVTYNVDAGSRITAEGTIVAYDINAPTTENIIYPWQIKSARYNSSGPAFTGERSLSKDGTIEIDKITTNSQGNTASKTETEQIQETTTEDFTRIKTSAKKTTTTEEITTTAEETTEQESKENKTANKETQEENTTGQTAQKKN